MLINKYVIQDSLEEKCNLLEFEKDDIFKDGRVYYSFLHIHKESLLYGTVDGLVRKKKPIVYLPNMYFYKIGFTPNEQIYIIGGSKNEEIDEVSDHVFKYTTSQSDVARVCNMINPRANFGGILHIKSGSIIVVGGDTGKKSQTYKGEMYDLIKDEWTSLPSISEPRSSMGLCTFGEEYLYAFGGMGKSEASSPILNIIERLNFKNKMYWEKVHLILPYPVGDIGLIQLGSNQILCFGGWNKIQLDSMFVVRIDRINHYLTEFKHSKLGIADSFHTNGVYYFEVNGMRVLGRKAIHQFDINTMRCISRNIAPE